MQNEITNSAIAAMIERLADVIDNPKLCEQDALESSHAMLTSLLAEREWRPIAEAPRDGTRFLFETAEGHVSIGWYMGSKGTVFAAENLGGRSEGPRRYLPIPKPSEDKP
jgi:hypothetical protein